MCAKFEGMEAAEARVHQPPDYSLLSIEKQSVALQFRKRWQEEERAAAEEESEVTMSEAEELAAPFHSRAKARR